MITKSCYCVCTGCNCYPATTISYEKAIYVVTEEDFLINVYDRMEQNLSGLDLMGSHDVSACFGQSDYNILFTGIAAFSEYMPRGLISLTDST